VSGVHAWLDSPLGRLLLLGEDGVLTGVRFPGGRHRDAVPPPDSREAPAALAEAREQLAAWFAGDRRDFDLPLRLDGTAFQRRVWAQLRTIPFGATTHYGAIAEALGEPGAARAVGAANGRNPIPVIVPCHRVIGADGALTGFGGGLERKRWLLAHEGAPGAQGELFAARSL
jgi:methylated-DNA-[protein]-cysteine S-methyltransferase